MEFAYSALYRGFAPFESESPAIVGPALGRCEPEGAVEVETVARVTPRADGRFRAAIPVPAGERAAV